MRLRRLGAPRGHDGRARSAGQIPDDLEYAGRVLSVLADGARRPEDVAQDEEGLQTMRQLARNLLWLLQCIAAGDAAGVPRPETEARKFTNFIR